MIYDNEDRPRLLAVWLIENSGTVRSAAKAFGVSKSTVHKDITKRLMTLDPVLCAQVRSLLSKNKSERHLRGGHATRLKYLSGGAAGRAQCRSACEGSSGGDDYCKS